MSSGGALLGLALFVIFYGYARWKTTTKVYNELKNQED